jgi:hypothetical protein
MISHGQFSRRQFCQNYFKKLALILARNCVTLKLKFDFFS